MITWVAGKRFKRVHSPTAGRTADTTTITTTASGLAFLQRRYFWSPNRGVLDSIVVGSQTVKFGYNGELLRNTITYPSFARRDSTSASHQSYFASYSTSSLDTLFKRSYSLDALGRITAEYRPDHYDLDVRSYQYNGLGALYRYERSTADTSYFCHPVMDETGGHMGCELTGSVTPYESHKYGYDELSNFRADTNSTTGVITNGTFSAGNRLGSWGGVTYTYDADGNRIERDSSTSTTYYDWTAGGKLYQIRKGSNTTSYDYNAFGQLVRRSTNGTGDRTYLWDRGQLLSVLNGTATAKLAEYSYRPGVDQPLSYITGNTGSTIRYFQSDERGDVIGLVSGSQPAQHLLYDPWGRPESQWGVSLDSTGLGWKGLLRESGSGLYYARARWYDMQSRSFISEDPIGISGGLNTYAFGANDPVNFTDPSGTKLVFVYEGNCQWSVDLAYPDIVYVDYSGCHLEGGGSIDYSPIYEYLGPYLGPGSEPHGGGGGGGAGGSGDSRPTLLEVSKEVSRRLTVFNDAMECGGKTAYAAATVYGDGKVLTGLVEAGWDAVLSAVAARKVFRAAMTDITASNPATNLIRNAAVADATVAHGEAVDHLHHAGDEYLDDLSGSAFSTATEGKFDIRDYIPGLAAWKTGKDAIASCRSVNWR